MYKVQQNPKRAKARCRPNNVNNVLGHAYYLTKQFKLYELKYTGTLS